MNITGGNPNVALTATFISRTDPVVFAFTDTGILEFSIINSLKCFSSQ